MKEIKKNLKKKRNTKYAENFSVKEKKEEKKKEEFIIIKNNSKVRI